MGVPLRRSLRSTVLLAPVVLVVALVASFVAEGSLGSVSAAGQHVTPAPAVAASPAPAGPAVAAGAGAPNSPVPAGTTTRPPVRGGYLTSVHLTAAPVAAVRPRPVVTHPAVTAHPAATTAPARPPAPADAARPAPPATVARPAPAPVVAAAAVSGYGCGAALAYLSTHAAPGFRFECPGYALGHQAMTCMNVAGVCPGENLIAIAVPCPAAYMNEANNSWVLSEGRSGPIDPYGYCPD